MSDPTPTDDADRRVLKIVRDATFHRFCADEGLIDDLGRDLEIGFIQWGSLFLKQTDRENTEVTDAQRVLTEVARMRISYTAFLNLSMNFLQIGIEEGKLKGDAVLTSITEWVANANETQASDDLEH